MHYFGGSLDVPSYSERIHDVGLGAVLDIEKPYGAPGTAQLYTSADCTGYPIEELGEDDKGNIEYNGQELGSIWIGADSFVMFYYWYWPWMSIWWTDSNGACAHRYQL